jgi:lysophospholipase L1-like esterase
VQPVRRALPVLVLALLAPGAASGVSFATLVALGDSLTRAQSNAVPHVARQLGVPLHNLAVNGATTGSLLSGGQLEQAAALDPTFAFLWIGGNDMKNDPVRFVARDWDAWLASYTTALDGLLATGADVMTANMFDVALAPWIYSNITPNPSAGLLSLLRDTTIAWNQRIEEIAAARGVAVVDVFSLFEAMAAGDLRVAGHRFALAPARGDGMHLFADTMHPSLVARGVIANAFIDELNAVYGLAVPQLSEATLAGIAGVPIPEPGTALLVASGLALLAAARLRGRAA